MTATQHNLPGGWALEVDPDAPEGFRVFRPDGRFFSIVFDEGGHGQPLLVEQPNAQGVTGQVIAVVQKIKGEWRVVVTRNNRPANGYEEPLVEGSRHSVTNDQPFLDVRDYPIVLLSGSNHTNSARIQDRVLFGVVVDHGGSFPMPGHAFTMTFSEFFRTSTDTMTKAVLGQFMVEILGLV